MRCRVYSMNEHVILLRFRATLEYKGEAGGPGFAYPNVPKFLTMLFSSSLRFSYIFKQNYSKIHNYALHINRDARLYIYIYIY
jgi:hypothetical protein